MAENDQDIQDSWIRQIGVFPLIVAMLGGGAFLAGLAIPILSWLSQTAKERIDAVRDPALIPALLISIGLLLLCVFHILRDLRLMERKLAGLTEHAFDREVAALLAALRPFAERLEERIGPVLTAFQKLGKPLDALHLDLQKQFQRVQELSGTLDEMKLLVTRLREDFTLQSRGRSIEPVQKQLEEIAGLVRAKGGEAASLEPLQKALDGILKTIQERQDKLAQSLSEIQGETKAASSSAQQALSAAQQAGSAAQKAATAAERAAAAAERIQHAPVQTVSHQEEKAPTFAPRHEPEKPAPEPVKEPAAPASTSPQEKRSIKDAIAKLRQFRGGSPS